MAYFDFSPEELQEYRPDRKEPGDFDSFWAETLAEAEGAGWPAEFLKLDLPLPALDVYDVTFAGYSGQGVRAWLILPQSEKPLPCVVEYVGYGGGRGHPMDWLHWPAAGFATFVMDTRGQGGGWLSGATPDSAPFGMDPHTAGFLTLGISDPHTYYYRRLMTDAARAVAAAGSHPLVDASRIALTGHSQGGGLALAAAGLVPGVAALAADMPFLCDFPRAAVITDELPYAELASWMRLYPEREQQAFHTLSYFDGIFFARRAAAPAMFSAGLMDMVVPPSTVFAASNQYAGPASMRVFNFHEHEGGGSAYRVEQIRFFRKHFGMDS